MSDDDFASNPPLRTKKKRKVVHIDRSTPVKATGPKGDRLNDRMQVNIAWQQNQLGILLDRRYKHAYLLKADVTAKLSALKKFDHAVVLIERPDNPMPIMPPKSGVSTYFPTATPSADAVLTVFDKIQVQCAIDYGVPVLTFSTLEDAVDIISRTIKAISEEMAGKSQRRQRLKPNYDELQVETLKTVPKMSDEKARRLLQTFGSLKSIGLASEEQIGSISQSSSKLTKVSAEFRSFFSHR